MRFDLNKFNLNRPEGSTLRALAVTQISEGGARILLVTPSIGTRQLLKSRTHKHEKSLYIPA